MERDNYLRDHKHKEGSFILGKLGDEWQMFKNGEYFSAYPSDEEHNHLMANSNNDMSEDHGMLKKRIATMIRQEIYNSISSVEKLATKAGYEDFNIDYDEIVSMLKLKSYELWEDDLN